MFLLRVRVRKRHRALGMKPRLGMTSGTCRQASGARPPWRDNRRPRRVTRHMEKSQSRRISGRVAETPKPCIRKIAGSGLKSLHRPAKWRGAQIPTSSHQVALPRWHRAVPRWKHSDTGESAAWGRVGWGEGGVSSSSSSSSSSAAPGMWGVGSNLLKAKPPLGLGRSLGLLLLFAFYRQFKLSAFVENRHALPGRLELPTLRLTASRSNQLSYGSLVTCFR